MQHVRTARGYETLVVTHGEKKYVVTSTPQEVSNEAAQAIYDAGFENLVEVLVLDEAELEDAPAAPTSQPPVDLSAGVSAISGTGDPVLSPGDQPAEGDTDQAAAKATTTTGRKGQKGSN